jgi:hypothetical protein
MGVGTPDELIFSRKPTARELQQGVERWLLSTKRQQWIQITF